MFILKYSEYRKMTGYKIKFKNKETMSRRKNKPNAIHNTN